MISYVESEIFKAKEIDLLRKAVRLVDRAPSSIDGEPIRCHELARAVGERLGLDYEDGCFGFVEHTWLWTEPRTSERFCAPWVLPNVLDVYAPGSVPQVQLVHMANGLPSRYFLSNVFDVAIRKDVVHALLSIWDNWRETK